MNISQNIAFKGKVVVKGQNSELNRLEKMMPKDLGIVIDKLGDESSKRILCVGEDAKNLVAIRDTESSRRAFASIYMSEHAMWVNANKYFDQIGQGTIDSINELAKGAKKINVNNVIKAIEEGNFDFDKIASKSKNILSRLFV